MIIYILRDRINLDLFIKIPKTFNFRRESLAVLTFFIATHASIFISDLFTKFLQFCLFPNYRTLCYHFKKKFWVSVYKLISITFLRHLISANELLRFL